MKLVDVKPGMRVKTFDSLGFESEAIGIVRNGPSSTGLYVVELLPPDDPTRANDDTP